MIELLLWVLIGWRYLISGYCYRFNFGVGSFEFLVLNVDEKLLVFFFEKIDDRFEN